MLGVIDLKVNQFEKKLKSEVGRPKDEKLLMSSFYDYQDSCRLSKERLEVLLSRDLRVHEGLVEEHKNEKKMWWGQQKEWQAELQLSLARSRLRLDMTQMSETGSALNFKKEASEEGPIRKTPLFGIKK